MGHTTILKTITHSRNPLMIAIMTLLIIQIDGFHAESHATEKREELKGNGLLRIESIDVGLGQATLVILPNGKTMLIEGGKYSDSFKVLSTIKKHDITKVDVVVSTHPHDDHFGGLIGVIDNMPVGQVVDSGQMDLLSQTFAKYKETIEEKQVPFRIVRQGDMISLDPNVRIEILNPPASFPAGMHNETEFNNNSVVIKLTYGEFAALFPADVLMTAERRMANEYGRELKANVLLASHHGTKGASTQLFLSTVSPEVVLISPQQKSNSSLPSEIALNKFVASGIEHIYRTDLHGNILITSDGSHHYSIEASRLAEPITMPEFDSGATAIIIGSAITSILLLLRARRLGFAKSSSAAV